MIDLGAPLDLPGLAVRAWADSENPHQVWACADGPRWAVGSDGGPEASLLLYRRQGGEVEGGMATVTVDLALTTAERDAVAQAAAALLARPADDPAGTGEPPTLLPEVSPPQWSGGTILLELCAGAASTSEVAGMGDNRATFVLTLDAHSGPEVASAWSKGLPDARAVADLTVRSAARGASAGGSRTVMPGLRSQMDVAVAMTSAIDAPLHLTADLRLPPGARSGSTTEITL